MSQERVMLLIDADNLSVDVMEQAVRLLLNQHGGLHVRRAYCTAESAVANQSAFKRLGIKPMVNLAAGKNSTDIAMAVDAIDLVLSERPDVVVIASSDSDFAPLVQRLREKGCVVRGIGQKGKVGDETQDVYDDYTVIEHRGGSGTRAPGRAPGRSATPAARAPRPSRARAARPEAAAVPAAAAQSTATRGRGRGRGAGAAAPADEPWAAGAAPAEAAHAPQRPAEPAPMVAAVLAALAPAEPPPAPAQGATGATSLADEKVAEAGPETAAETAAQATPAKPATKRAPRARKTAASAAAVVAAEPAPAADEAAPAAPAPARSRARKPKVAAAEPAAPEAVAPPAPVPAPAPEPVPAPPPAPRPAPAAPVAPAATAPADRTPAPRVTLQAVLNCLPELARGQSIALNVAVQRLREARLLGKNSSSLKLFSQFSDSLDLLPARNPSQVRLRA